MPELPPVRKSLGQNFLHDRGVIERIIAALSLRPEQSLLEIGPGRGALTGPLLAAGVRLTAVELDPMLGRWLEDRFGHHPRLRLVIGNAMTVNLGELLPPEPVRVVGNLPYNIAVPLLFKMLDCGCDIVDMHLMVQREVGQRLSASPDTAHYGRSSVQLRFCCCEVAPVLRVGSGAFTPAPRVDSMMIRLRPRQPMPAATERRRLDRVLRAAFGQRRKTLRRSLAGLITEPDWAELGIDPQWRPARLSLEQFVAIASRLTDVAAGKAM